MSTTTLNAKTRALRKKDGPAGGPAPAPGENLAPPPKLRRRPALIAASIAAICLGALVSLWAYQSSSSTHSVLAMRQTVERGQVISRDNLMSVSISVDPALHPLSANQSDSVVGKHAALDMPAGGLVTADQVTDQALPAKGSSIVGISLTPGMLPVDQVQMGDHVRIVSTPGQQGDVAAGAPDLIDAVVVGLSKDGTTGNTIVNVQVPSASAARLAALAATGKAALVLDSRER